MYERHRKVFSILQFLNLREDRNKYCYSMSEKIKFEQEYLLKTSPKVLNSMLMTPSGLSEWFSDDVNIKEDIYTFYWSHRLGTQSLETLYIRNLNYHQIQSLFWISAMYSW